MWDTLVGGLAGSQEDLEQALLRECAEEAGLEPAPLANRTPLRTILRMHRRLPEGYQVEDLLTRSEEHTSELQSLMRISYAVFCLQKKTPPITHHTSTHYI